MFETIIQNIRIKVEMELTATVETPIGADTQKILDSLGPEVVSRVQAIPWVARLHEAHVTEVAPKMASLKTN